MPILKLVGACGLLAWCSLFTTTANAVDWGVNANFVCDDPLIIRQQSFFLQWFPRPGAIVIAPFGNEKYRVEINQKYLNDGTIKVGLPFTTNVIELDRDRLSLMRYLVGKREHDSDLPFWITSETKLLPFVLTSVETGIITPLFQVLFAAEKARHQKISELEVFLALGGKLIQEGQVDRSRDGRYVATEIIRYRVSLGKEEREFLLYSCIYPATVIIRGVKTVGSPNPKIFTRNDQSTWVMTNGDTGNKERDYVMIESDDNYVILKEAGNVPEELKSQLRISRKGGPIESLRDGTWRILYQKTELL